MPFEAAIRRLMAHLVQLSINPVLEKWGLEAEIRVKKDAKWSS